MAGRVEMRRGTSDDLVTWEPVLRAMLDERPVHEPGAITFGALDGGTLDLERSFTLDDADEEIGHFLAETGYVHLEGVFTEQAMAAVSAELEDAVAEATHDDGASWWARTADGWYASRILGFNLKSPTLQELLSSDWFRAIGGLTDDEMVQRPPRDGDSAEGLHKKVGVLEGISDVSWHKDCSMGGHSRRCCGMVTGISVTGADAGSGELGVVAGSNRANVQPLDVRRDLDLPRIPLPTRTGDVTVHCTCTLHMSRPPVERERQVVYTGFDLAPRAQDVVDQQDPVEVRRARAALNDQVRTRRARRQPRRYGRTFRTSAEARSDAYLTRGVCSPRIPWPAAATVRERPPLQRSSAMAIDRQESPYRRGNRYNRLPIPMVTEHCIHVDAGAVQLVVESRKLTNEIIKGAFHDVDAQIAFDDFGATLHVCGAADGVEHLRFDCFENEPHYHYIEQATGANTVVRIDELAVGDPIDFSLACIEHHLPDMLRHCGVGDLADAVADQPDTVSTAVAEVRELMTKARYRVA